MATTIGTAYVQILPSTKGLSSKISESVDEGTKEAASKMKKSGGGFSSLFSDVGKAIAGGLVATTVAGGALVASAVNSYAEYEQLIGGVETLFGDSASVVQGYADTAFQTAGLSANAYMETVTSFSASLLQSLGGDTAAAAEYADKAVTDMSDNANKMGTSMESIQNAYQGFAKQNYTMLDNLKLGYGGTKSEMERLILDAEKLDSTFVAARDENGELAMSYADIVDAIHIVQDDMGITGTTAKEASATISGSIGATKAAWQNLVTGFANKDADIGGLMRNVVDSGLTALNNIIPAVKTAVEAIGTAIKDNLPQLIESGIGLINDVLPELLTVGGSMLGAIADGIVANFPTLLDTAKKLVIDFGGKISESLPSIFSTGVDILTQIVDGITETLPELIPVAIQTIESLAMSLTDPDSLGKMIDSALGLMQTLADGIIEALPQLIAMVPVIITRFCSAIVDHLPQILEQGTLILAKLVFGIAQAAVQLVDVAVELVKKFVNSIKNNWDQIVSVGKNIVNGVWEGISNMAGEFAEKVKGFFSNIVDNVKNVLGIHSPSRVFANIGEMMGAGLGVGFTDEMEDVKKDINSEINGLVPRNIDGINVTGSQYSGFGVNGHSAGETITIVVQSVLDGTIIGETAYKYNKSRNKVYGT